MLFVNSTWEKAWVRVYLWMWAELELGVFTFEVNNPVKNVTDMHGIAMESVVISYRVCIHEYFFLIQYWELGLSSFGVSFIAAVSLFITFTQLLTF